jgi:hypothetical protein
MLNKLKKIIGTPDALPRLAKNDCPESFIHELCESQVFVIAKGDYDNGLPPDSSRSKIMAILEKEAVRINMQQSFEMYTYESDGVYHLPFFTDQERAQEFCHALAEERQRIFPFTVLGVSGQMLAKYAETRLEIIMNDKTANQYILSEKDRALLIALIPHD